MRRVVARDGFPRLIGRHAPQRILEELFVGACAVDRMLERQRRRLLVGQAAGDLHFEQPAEPLRRWPRRGCCAPRSRRMSSWGADCRANGRCWILVVPTQHFRFFSQRIVEICRRIAGSALMRHARIRIVGIGHVGIGARVVERVLEAFDAWRARSSVLDREAGGRACADRRASNSARVQQVALFLPDIGLPDVDLRSAGRPGRPNPRR